MKNGKVFTNKFVGTGPSSFEKRIYLAAVSRRLKAEKHCSRGCVSGCLNATSALMSSDKRSEDYFGKFAGKSHSWRLTSLSKFMYDARLVSLPAVLLKIRGILHRFVRETPTFRKTVVLSSLSSSSLSGFVKYPKNRPGVTY